MLARSALRAVNRRPLAIARPPIKVAIASQVRCYAKHRAPKKDHSPFDNESGISPEAQRYNAQHRESSPVDAAKVLQASQPHLPKSTELPRQSSNEPQFEQVVDDLQKSSEQTAESSSQGGSPPETEAPAQPLPDLRQGIPSTFSAEFGKQETSKESEPNITEDPRNPNPSPGGGGEREMPKSAYETSTDRRRNKYANWSALAFVLFGAAGAAYYGRNWESEEERAAFPDAPDGWSPTNVWNRIQARWGNQLSYYTEPTFPKLLPVVDPAPPYTLVLSLNDLLIHSEWTREHGWRTAKRPGLDYFLRYLCQYYEIVVFTDLPSAAADPIIRKLDPLRMVIMWPLFREATRYEKGEYIKVSF